MAQQSHLSLINAWFLAILCLPHLSYSLKNPHLDFRDSPSNFNLPQRTSPITEQQSGVHRKLSEVNKPAIKSIQSTDGDIIDCVPIDKQPALDHPKLKDHKIKTYPTARPQYRSGNSGKLRNTTRGAIHQVWKQSGGCPQGTVPIRRTSSADVERASSLERFGQKSSAQQRFQKPVKATTRDDKPSASAHDHAIAYVSGGEYYGSTATLNVWDPWVEDPSEFSLSQIWILSGSFDGDLNTIEAGWQVSPELYGDNRPRFFIYWTADAYQQTGCYNLLCAGFVQTSSEIAMGAAISPWSSYRSAQYDIKILIWKDPSMGDWWMEFGDKVLVGYWPAKLFTHLGNKATVVEWGGEVAQAITPSLPRRHTGTHMGSGRFAQDGFGGASYFRNIEVVNSNNELETIATLSTSADQPSCYNIRSFYNSNWGNFFYYGGPGRNPSCP